MVVEFRLLVLDLGFMVEGFAVQLCPISTMTAAKKQVKGRGVAKKIRLGPNGGFRGENGLDMTGFEGSGSSFGTRF